MTKYAGRGIVFSIEESSGSPSPVGQVTALGEAGSSRDLIDASAYGDDWKDYVVGQQDGDELATEVAYDPEDNSHAALKEAYDAGVPETFHMQHDESGFHVKFPAYVTKLARGGAKDGVLMMAMTLKIVNPGVEDVEESS